MVKLVLFVLAHIALTSGLSYHDLDALGPVIFSNVVYRHGDRNPISFYPYDPYQDLSLYPEGLGALTEAGKARHYKVGQWLKNHYKYLLSEYYDPNEIYIISADVDRCLMSAEANLAGMYPPHGWQKWGSLDWQPIPVHTIPMAQDNLIEMSAPCEKYEILFNQSLKTGLAKKWHDEYDWAMKYMSKHAGMVIDDLVHFQYMYSAIHIEDQRNFTLPKWLAKIYPETMRSASHKFFRLQTLKKDLQRLVIGPLMKDMISHFTMKANKTLNPDRKVWVYSAHDITIANILNTLNMFDETDIPYATVLLLEMREDPRTNKYTINFLLKNETESEPYVLKMPECSVACPLDRFIELTKDIIPTDWSEECKPTSTKVLSDKKKELKDISILQILRK